MNQDFLNKLMEYPHRTVFARLTALDFKTEYPIKEITGRFTGGSINIDGASAVRRTCSLTIATEKEQMDYFYWGLKTKFKLEVGLENVIDSNYPNIIWFKQGIFVITQISESANTSSYTINISAKDKGCLINGEIGGSLPATIDFGKIDTYSKNDKNELVKTTTYLEIKDIIKNSMMIYGGERLENIIINDVDDYGLELLNYNSDTPLYMLYNYTNDSTTNFYFNGNIKIYYKQEGSSIEKSKTLNELTIDELYSFIENDGRKPLAVSLNEKSNSYNYYVVKFTKGDAVGYRKTELTYPGDLVGNPGEALSAILDKIKNIFSTFEYFYNIDGKFIFQKKKIYTTSSFSTIVIQDDEVYVNPSMYSSEFIYSFQDNSLLTAVSRNPTITNIKNDFSLSGVRKNANGIEINIHMRYALAEKPVAYYSNKNKRWYFADISQIPTVDYDTSVVFWKVYNKILADWANDKNNKALEEQTKYTDWREIIYQMAVDFYELNEQDDYLSIIGNNNKDFYPSGVTGYEPFYVDLYSWWRDIYNPDEKDNDNFDQKTHFNTDVYTNPSTLNFWFDFMEPIGEIGKYQVKTIGHRPKAVKETTITSLFYRKTPTVLFVTGTIEPLDRVAFSGYTLINLPTNYSNYFTVSSRGVSAKSRLDELLEKHLFKNENITLTTIPLYNLEPNCRIFVRDDNTNIAGEYLLNKISIPLTYNGTSSLQAQIAPERLY